MNKNELNVGVVGLGLMGIEIARRLYRVGFDVVGFDKDESRRALFENDGGKVVKEVSGILSVERTILLSLPDSNVVNEVIRNEMKLFERPKKGLTIIDTTTSEPLMTKRLAGELRDAGIEMLDATISGTPGMCAEGEIIIMVGGDKTTFEKCRSILSSLARKVFYLGPSGMGSTMKLIVNLVLGLNRMVLAEGLSLAKKSGIKLDTVLNVLRESAAYSKAIDMKGRRMVDGDFLPPHGKLALHLKDVRMILELGNRSGIPLFLSSIHAQALRSLVEKGRGDWDNSAIISFYEDLVNPL